MAVVPPGTLHTMPYTTILLGPPIAGGPIRYWTRRAQSTTTKRKLLSLTAEWLLSNPTAYSKWKSHESNEPDIGRYGEFSPVLGSYPAAESLIPFNVLNNIKLQAMSRLREKVKGEQWNLGTFLGELPETQKYFCKVISDVVSLYKSVKSGKVNRRKLKSLARKGRAYLRRRGLLGTIKDGAGSLSSAWLQFRYAICPVVYDLDDMLKVLYSQASNPSIARAAGGMIGTETYLKVGRSEEPYYEPTYSWKATVHGRALVYYRVNTTAKALKRLGLINLGAVLWELTPLSFVADMFLPIGDFIGQLDAMAGVDVLSCTYSQTLEITSYRSRVAYTGKTVEAGKTITWYAQKGGSSGYGKYYRRELATPVTPLSFSTSPTGKQLVDLVALSRSILFK